MSPAPSLFEFRKSPGDPNRYSLHVYRLGVGLRGRESDGTPPSLTISWWQADKPGQRAPFKFMKVIRFGWQR